MEANFEVRQPDANADPASPEGQRQIFLRHGTQLHAPSKRSWRLIPVAENLRVLRQPPSQREESDEE